MTESLDQIYVLCCTGRNWGIRLRLPSQGAFVIPENDIDGVQLDALIGLPFGVGSPELARFPPLKDRLGQLKEWLVIRVAAKDAVPVCDSDIPAACNAVQFRRGFVIYCGDRRGALETLIQYGADNGAMTVQLALPDVCGVSRAGSWGVAIGATHGYAQAGEHGIAIAGAFGVARAGVDGEANVETTGGLAVVEAGGTATTGWEGIAIARGRGGKAGTLDYGISVGLSDVDKLQTQKFGVAVARRDAGIVETGESSIVVIGDTPATGRGVQIKAGPGTLIVCRSSNGGACVTNLVAVAGRRGFKAETTYDLVDGDFREQESLSARTFPSDDPTGDEGAIVQTFGGTPADERFTFAALPSQPWWEAAAAVSPGADVVETTHAPGATIVLRRTSDKWTRFVEVEKLCVDDDEFLGDPNPDSNKGLFGLAWGRGDASHLGYGDLWTLLIAERPIDVPTSDGGYVKFERGEVIYSGDLPGAMAGLRAMGVDLASMAVEISVVGDAKVARVGQYGAAISGDRGWAIAGSHAQAGREGYAEAWDGGIASAGPNGIARVGEGGTAIAEIAVSSSRYCRLNAFGLAVAHEDYVNVSAHGGIAIGWLGTVEAHPGAGGQFGIAIGSGKVVVGNNGIAIARGGHAKVRGGMGALLVLRNDVDREDWISAVVGEDGIEPNVDYSAHGGAFIPSTTV